MHEPQPKNEEKPNRTGIPSQLKKEYETASGLSLDDVRVHYRSNEPSLLHSYAYTQGNQVHIAPGQERHLPHELGHVIQQKRGIVRPTMQYNGLAINDQVSLERDADSIPVRSASGGNTPYPLEYTHVVQAKGPYQLEDLIKTLLYNLNQMEDIDTLKVADQEFQAIKPLIQEYDGLSEIREKTKDSEILSQIFAKLGVDDIVKKAETLLAADRKNREDLTALKNTTATDAAKIADLEREIEVFPTRFFGLAKPDKLHKLLLNELLIVLRQQNPTPGILINPYDKMMASKTFNGSSDKGLGLGYFVSLSKDLISRLQQNKPDPELVDRFKSIITANTELAHYSSYGEHIFPLVSYDAIHASNLKPKKTTPSDKEDATSGQFVTKSQVSDVDLGNTNFVFFFLRRKGDSVPSKFGKFRYNIPFERLPSGAMAMLADIIFPYQGWSGYKLYNDTMVYDPKTEEVIARLLEPEKEKTKLSLRSRLKSATLYRKDKGPEILHISSDGKTRKSLPLCPKRDIAVGEHILDALAYRAAIHVHFLQDVGQKELVEMILKDDNSMADFVTSMITVQIIVPYYAFPESVRIIEPTRSRTHPPVEESSSSSIVPSKEEK